LQYITKTTTNQIAADGSGHRVRGGELLHNGINVVIVTYNNRELLNRCISSVMQSIERAGLNGLITVVDNDSKDGTEEFIAERYPQVQYLKNSENLGTAKAFNRGIRSGWDRGLTMLMNDDVELFPETLGSMIALLDRHPDARGVPARPVYPDGSSQRVKLGIFGLKRIRNNRIRRARFSGTTACLYQTELFREVGLFDEFYFFYNEDLDFSLRAKRRGIHFIFDPGIRVIHQLNQGRAKGEKFIKPHLYSANFYFYRKHFGLCIAFLYYLITSVHLFSYGRKLRNNNETDQYKLLQEGKILLQKTFRNCRSLSRPKGGSS
jgi:GT2 family glycosyltransferase